MIRQTVEAAKGKKGAPVPPRLVFAQWCQHYRALPGPGGLGDQDYREMYLNDVLPRIYEAVYAWRNNGGAGLSQGHRNIINWLAKIGAM